MFLDNKSDALYYFCFYDAVMEWRAGREISWVDPEKFADIYLAGRASSTFPTYDMAFRKIMIHGLEIGKCVIYWSPMDLAGYLLLLDGCNATINMVKQASAVVTMMKELVELESIASSRIVKTVKRGVMKAARERELLKKKRVKSVMTLDHIRLFICKLYKKPASKVKAADRRFLVMMMLLFFGIRRFDDIKKLRVCDINVLKGGHLEFYVTSSKTDQLSNGFIFHVTGDKIKGFSIPQVLYWYIESVGLRGEDYLFPRFRYEKGRIVAQRKYFISYSCCALQLKKFCLNCGIPPLTLHSGRRGGATAAVEAGIDRFYLKEVGNWTSDAVDSYFCPRRAGVKFTSKLINKL